MTGFILKIRNITMRVMHAITNFLHKLSVRIKQSFCKIKNKDPLKDPVENMADQPVMDPVVEDPVKNIPEQPVMDPVENVPVQPVMDPVVEVPREKPAGPAKDIKPYEEGVDERINLQEILRLADVLQEQMEMTTMDVEFTCEQQVENIQEQIDSIMDRQELTLDIRKGCGDPKQCFCSIAGTKYLIKILAFYESLNRVTTDYKLFICCMDDFIYEFLNEKQFENVILIHVKDVETDALRQTRQSRTMSEYCWTMKSWLISYIFEHYKVNSAIYCDSDMYFFSDTIAIYNDWGEASLYLCLQRDLDWVEKKYGVYQAGLVGFKNNEIGRNAVNWWKQKCLEWCYLREDPDSDRWGDQKYLDHLPRLFADTKISGHLGINAAPWNTIYNNNYQITRSETNVLIEGYELVAYHFACIDIFDQDHYDLWNLGSIKISNVIKNGIYLPYLMALRNSMGIIGEKVGACYSDKKIEEAKTPLKYSEFDVIISKWDNMYYFCSIASEKYVFKVLTLYRSLLNQMESFHLWICCIDIQSYTLLKSLNLSNATLLPLDKIENERVKAVRPNRKLNEFCWTLKPVLCSYILENYNVEKLLYCDADIYFFSHPKAIYDEWEGHSVLITRQRAPGEMEKTNGIYQAGLLGFSKDGSSSIILKWWMEKCLEWCHDYPEPQFPRWGDQKYLDQFPQLFSNIKISEHNGINTAPWNIILNPKEPISVRNEQLYIGEHGLVAYHFGSLLIFNEDEFDLWKWSPLNIDFRVMQYAYFPYLNALRHVMHSVKPIKSDMESLFTNKDGYDFKNYMTIKK